MFGYIKIDKNDLKIRDYNLFKSYYCGVCRALKKEYGFPAHYFLSYDVTFLALLLDALSDKAPALCQTRCMANPMVLRPVIEKNDAVSYAAAVNILLVWFKLKDDRADNRSLKALCLMPFMFFKQRKARKRFPVLYEAIKARLLALSALEKENCPEPDAVAAIFGQLMADIFQFGDALPAETSRILAHTGSLLGRLVYLLDAWADREEDKKKNSYNPFLIYKEEGPADVRLSIDYTLGELANSLNLLTFYRNREIIENIVYLGLRNVVDGVFSDDAAYKKRTKEKHHERPI